MMKHIILALATAVVMHQAMASPPIRGPLATSDEGKRVYAEIVELAKNNDINAMAKKLPEIDTLWENDHEGYMHAIYICIPEIAKSRKPEAIMELTATLDKLLKKRAPADPEMALTYYLSKGNILSEVGKNRLWQADEKYLLFAAELLGEIREKKIANYVPQKVPNLKQKFLEAAGVTREEDLPNTAQKEALAKAHKENEYKGHMDYLQKCLSGEEYNYTQHVTRGIRDLKLPSAEKAEIIRKVAVLAKLTDEEIKKINEPK